MQGSKCLGTHPEYSSDSWLAIATLHWAFSEGNGVGAGKGRTDPELVPRPAGIASIVRVQAPILK